MVGLPQPRAPGGCAEIGVVGGGKEKAEGGRGAVDVVEVAVLVAVAVAATAVAADAVAAEAVATEAVDAEAQAAPMGR